MCGRYSLTLLPDFILNELELDLPEFGLTARYNAAPTQLLPVVTLAEPGMIQMFRWGLIPFWAKDPAIGNKMINARAETLTEKTSWRNLLKKNRCLVLADGFYEWKKTEAGKRPMHISLKSKKLLTFAGLWDQWSDPEGREIRSFTIITCAPNKLMKGIHDRMPAILDSEARKQWLDPSLDVADAMQLLKPFGEGLLEAKQVSTKVNSPAYDGPEIFNS